LVRNYYWQSRLLHEIKEVQPYLSADLFLRESVIRDLVLLDTFLQVHGLRFLILSGYRHPELQGIIIREVTKIKGSLFANKMFANPEFYAPHATGAAFDLEIWNEENEEILPTKVIDGLDRYCLEGSKNLSSEQKIIRDNRRLIHNLLTSDFILSGDSSFVGHPFEYWHYGRHERLSSFFAANGHPIYYDVVSLAF